MKEFIIKLMKLFIELDESEKRFDNFVITKDIESVYQEHLNEVFTDLKKENQYLIRRIKRRSDEIDELAEKLERSVTWSVDDFKHLADQNPDVEYDEDIFDEALDSMINSHDASIGITWDTIQSYLDDYCLKITEEDFNENR